MSVCLSGSSLSMWIIVNSTQFTSLLTSMAFSSHCKDCADSFSLPCATFHGMFEINSNATTTVGLGRFWQDLDPLPYIINESSSESQVTHWITVLSCARYIPNLVCGDMDSARKEILEFYESKVSLMEGWVSISTPSYINTDHTWLLNDVFILFLVDILTWELWNFISSLFQYCVMHCHVLTIIGLHDNVSIMKPNLLQSNYSVELTCLSSSVRYQSTVSKVSYTYRFFTFRDVL